MKKLITTLLLLAAISFYSQAQWVSIPDTNFGKWLNTNGYSACLQGNSQVGWQMDTTCNAVVNANTISCTSNNISNLIGVQYFDALLWLDCSSNPIDSLPTLPVGLTTLICVGLRITNLPPLPVSLSTLYANYNPFLIGLPTLSSGLQDLRCIGNPLITSLPVLPNNLSYLDCHDNQLASLPALPNSLRTFLCAYNQLMALPQLPDTLDNCYIGNNPLACLPKLTRINTLNFTNTAVTCIPNYGNVTNSTPLLSSLALCQPGNVNGCAFDSTLVFANAGGDTAICSGGSIVIGGNPTASWGTPPYVYTWSGGAAPVANPTVQPASTTTYCVTVTDSVGVSAADCVTVSVNPNPVADAGAPTTICAGASATLGGSPTASGGTINFFATVSSTSAGSNLITISSGNTTSWSLHQPVYFPTSIGGISAGTYYLLTKNSPTTFTITATSGGSTAISLTTATGNVNITVGAYSYSWAPVLNLLSPTSANPIASPASNTTYCLTVTDAANCSATACKSVSVSNTLSVSIVKTDVSCNGGSDGSLCANVTGGTPGYVYVWSNGATTQCITNLAAAPYVITVTDAGLCTATASAVVTQPALLTISIVNSGNGILPDTLGVTSSGGTLPYTFMWSNGYNLPNGNIVSTSGTYSVTVWDSNACSASDAINLSCTPPSVSIAPPAVLTCTATSVTLTALSGSQDVSYNWGGGVITPAYTVSNPGTYSVTVTDTITGCTASASVSVVQDIASPTVSISPPPALTCQVTSVALSTTAFPASVSYFWNTFAAASFITVSSGGLYSVTVTDPANGCTASASVNVVQFSSPSLQVTSATNGALPDTLCATVTGGVPPYLYNWNGNVNGLPNLCFELLSGPFTITVQDNNGCTASFSTNSLCPNHCVWPGDADYNGIADNNDLLPIGLAYGKSGTARAQQDINWYAHVAADWIDTITTTGSGSTGNNIITVASASGISLGMAVSGTGIGVGAVVTSIAGTTLALSVANVGIVSGTIMFITPSVSSGVNSKHIDCDGNGIINADDTTAIMQNFGLLHAKTDDDVRGWRMTDPSFYVTLVPDTTHAGDTLYANLTLGDTSIPANNIYGLAFTLNYDATVVDSSKTKITFGNSWLGNATDKISIAKDFYPSGKLKCAITRIDHATRSGFGQIGQAEFVITTDNINGKNLAYYQMNVWLSDLRVIDNLGNLITINEGRDSSEVEFEEITVDNGQWAIGNFKIQPNPAKDEVQVTVTDELLGGELKVFDVNGQLLVRTSITTYHLPLTTQHFFSGVYFIQVLSGKGLLTKRLVIAR